MGEFAFRNKRDAAFNRGTLEVRAKRDSKRGLSDEHVPAGTLGYVHGNRDGKYVVHWPSLEASYKGDWKTSVHDKDDLEPTGRRVPR